jgi:hypothetical protein
MIENNTSLCSLVGDAKNESPSKKVADFVDSADGYAKRRSTGKR